MRTKRHAISWLVGALFLMLAWNTPAVAQSILPPFVLNALTTLTVTVVLSDGQVFTIPIDLAFTTRSAPEGAYLALNATAKPVAGAIVHVHESGIFTASMQAPVTPTPTALIVAPPTAPPLPIPTPTATPTIETTVGPFIAEAQFILAAYSETMIVIGEQLTHVGNDPNLVNDETWQLRTATAFALLGELNEKVRETSAPPSYQPMWAELTTMANLLDEMISAYTTGIDQRNAAEIVRGTQLLEQAQAAMQRAVAAFPAP